MEIANLKVYNDNMRKSLLDKAYFLSFVDWITLKKLILRIRIG